MKSKYRQTKFEKLIALSLLVIILITAPFWHKLFPKEDSLEFMGFSNIRRFLYALGTHISCLAVSVFLTWIARNLIKTYKMPVYFVSFIFMGISLYFIFWTLAPITDYPRYIYEIVIISLSCCCVFIISIVISMDSLYKKRVKQSDEFIKNSRILLDKLIQDK